MDAMVTARVPVEIKKQGDEILKRIGSSATELVNAAYNYVLEHGELPQKKFVKPTETQYKVLRGEEARKFREEWDAMKMLDMPEYDGTNFKELLGKAREERYEGIA